MIDWSKIDLSAMEKAPPPPKAFCDGGKAYMQQKSESDNPHPVGTLEHQQWKDGFEEAQSADEYMREPQNWSL